MPAVFIHTADWQLGKPFAGVESEEKRVLLQNARIEAIHRIGELARGQGAEFMVVSGDLFDSITPTKNTVSSACAAIGAIGVPVFVIPGNHDHAGAGTVWRQDFYLREQAQLAPNLNVLLDPKPVVLESVVLFPCPLLRRHETQDLLAWLRGLSELDQQFGGKARVVIAHGSTVDFRSSADEEDDGGGVNVVDVTRVPEPDFDYIALGDWHGAKQVGAKAWYSGTPEPDRFARGEDYQAGHILRVQAERGKLPVVEQLATGGMSWKEMAFNFETDADLPRLAEQVDTSIANQANRGLLRLRLSGALGIEASAQLERHLDAWRSRLIRLKLDQHVGIAPTDAELTSLCERTSDPLISRVAARLTALVKGDGPDAPTARVALRELYLSCARHSLT